MKTTLFFTAILMLFNTTALQAQSTNNKTINASTLNQLAGMWQITIKSQQSGTISNTKMEIRIVNGVLEAWRAPNGKADIKYTMFKVYEDKGGLSFIFELNVPPGIKSEGTGSFNNNLSQMKGMMLLSVANNDMLGSTNDWTAKKETTTTNDLTIPASTLKENPAITDLPVAMDKLDSDFFSQYKTIFNSDWENLKGKEIGILSYADYYQVYYECTKPLTGFKVIAFKRINKWGTYYFVIATVQEKEKAKEFYSQINDELSRLKNDGYIMDATQSDSHQGFWINKNENSFGNAYLNNDGIISITFNHSVIAQNGQKVK